MSQADFGDIDPSQTSGTELANIILEPFRDALHSSHKGATRPGYAVAGMLWVDDSSEPWLLKFFDGSADRVIAQVNPTSGLVRFTGVVGSQASPVTSVDASTIREAGSRVVKGASSPGDNRVPRFNVNGHTVQGSGVEIDDDDNIFGYGTKIEVETADFTLAAADAGKTKEIDNTGTSDLLATIPDNVSVPLPVGFSLTFVLVNTGGLDFNLDSGVVLQSESGNTRLDTQWGAATLYKRATDEWVLFGNLSA